MVTIVFLGLNRHGEQIYNWLMERNDADVLALLTHEDQYHTVEQLEPDLLLSSGFRFVVPPEIIEIPKLGAVNTHPSYLPYNRGANPNVWSIIDDFPAGVSIHYMTPTVDAGPIISRKKVEVKPDDNGRILYERLEQELVQLFKDSWSDIRDNSTSTVEQHRNEGTHHYIDEFKELFRIDRSQKISSGEFIDNLRALTFPPYNNAYFVEAGEKYYLDLEITHASDTGQSEGIHWNVPNYTGHETE